MKKGKEILLGLSFLIALALLYGGISFLKGRNIFSPYTTYYVRYADVTGLSQSSPIYANGVRVGIVSSINYNYSRPDDIIVRIGINKKMPIPQGTVARLDTELLGTVSMNLLLSPDSHALCQPGDTLCGTLDKGTISQLSQLMPQLVSLIPTVDSLLTSLHAIAADSAIQRTLHHAETLTGDASSTLASLNSTLRQAATLVSTYEQAGKHIDSLTVTLKDITTDGRIDEVIGNLDNTLQDLQKLTTALTSAEGTAGRLLTDPALYEELNAVCEKANALIDDIKTNPSRYIHLFGRQ